MVSDSNDIICHFIAVKYYGVDWKAAHSVFTLGMKTEKLLQWILKIFIDELAHGHGVSSIISKSFQNTV